MAKIKMKNNETIEFLANQILKKHNFSNFSIIEIHEDNFQKNIHLYSKISKRSSLNFNVDKKSYNEELQQTILEELPCQIIVFEKDLCLANIDEYLLVSIKKLNFLKILKSTNNYFIDPTIKFKFDSNNKDTLKLEFKKNYFEASEYNSLYFHIDYGYFNRESFLSFSKNLFSNNGKALEIQSSIVEKNAPVLKGLKDSSKCNYYLLLNLYYDNNIINKTAKAIKDENFKSNLIDNFIYLNCFLKLIEPFNLDTSKYESLYLKVEPTKEYVDKFYSIIKPLENIINI